MSLTIGTSEKQRRISRKSTKRAGDDDQTPAMGITITDTDFQRLKELIKRYRASWRTYGPYLSAVERELERARIVAASAVDANVITLSSRVKLRDLSTDETFAYTLVLPEDAYGEDDRLSVLAPLGTAILGASVGNIIRWPVPAGVRTVMVERVLYQPQAAGKE